MLTGVRSFFGFGGKPAPVPVVGGRGRIEIDPTDTAVYAIGDVHGCLEELLAAERRMTLRQVLGRDGRIASLMSLGDLDRIFMPETRFAIDDPALDRLLALWDESR